MSTTKKLICFLAVFLSVSACGARVPKQDTFEGRNLKIGKVDVQLAESFHTSDGYNVYQDLNGSDQIRDRTIAALQQANIYDSKSDLSLVIMVSDLRLRAAATKIFTGMLSGSDSVHANVAVMRRGAKLSSQDIRVAGGNGNPFAGSRDHRGTSLFDATGRRIAADLRRMSADQALGSAPATTKEG